MKLVLKKPITIADEPVKEIEFRDELCAGDWEGVAMRDPMLFDDMLRFAANISDLPVVAIKRLGKSDWLEVQKHLGKLLSDGPET